ncbi:hypothetical protein [Arthrobacter sp. SX1312]|uniref:hypothetical protein n=1 Tax=Arthrobacter sp. SX1312 TaxID=2058896 RepID=UPI000CE323DF|nr:hypothetical protein [Arthrobacter sp. SX1312]
MIACGLTGQHVARLLNLPLRAVEGHVHLILEVLGLARLEDLTEDAISGYGDAAFRQYDGGPVHPQPAAGPSRFGR